VSLHVQANLPSLLALPYYGWIANTDPLYIATRKAVLSSQNPWWFK
jgi:meiotically up-regulated gene 157 (Mug157) protein